MKKSYLLTLVIAGSLALTAFTRQPVLDLLDSSKKYLLRYNPKAGTSGKMVMDYNLDINMNVMGQSMDMAQVMEMGATMTIVENTGDQIKSTMAYDYMAMSMDNPMTGTLEYDSREEGNEDLFGAELAKAFDEILNKELNITQDHRGKTISSDLESAVGVKKNQGSLDFSSVISMSQFPEKAMAIGESWSTVLDDNESPMKFDITMTLKNVKDGKVFIDFQSDVSSNENFASEEDAEMDVSGTQAGSFIYKESSMWLLEGMINQDLEMTVKQMGMEIPMKLNGEMILTVE